MKNIELAPQDWGIGGVRNLGRRDFLQQISALVTSVAVSWISTPVTASSIEPTKAIQFEFTDKKGNVISLRDLRWKWVMVNFWMPSCSICKTQIEELKQIDGTKANDGRDIVVVYVALNYDKLFDNIDSSITLLGLQDRKVVLWGKSRGPDSPVRQVWPVDFFPTSYMYDPSGEIVAYGPWKVSLHWVAKIISQNTRSDMPKQKVALQDSFSRKAD